MKLSFLGQSYEATIAGTEAPTTEQTGTFLGKPYQMKQTHLAQRQTSESMTYRGVCYTR
ncbi:MAG: DUF4278 domain-containing protein [Gammaproteobacteria bacterium]|nr:MAG: DUF4278 domain-containing protein [Gammaproteobacteria bacterium]